MKIKIKVGDKVRYTGAVKDIPTRTGVVDALDRYGKTFLVWVRFGYDNVYRIQAENLVHVELAPETTPEATPPHYQLDPEPVDVIKAWGLDFCLGNVIEYVASAGRKDGETRDSALHEAMHYLRLALEDE